MCVVHIMPLGAPPSELPHFSQLSVLRASPVYKNSLCRVRLTMFRLMFAIFRWRVRFTIFRVMFTIFRWRVRLTMFRLMFAIFRWRVRFTIFRVMFTIFRWRVRLTMFRLMFAIFRWRVRLTTLIMRFTILVKGEAHHVLRFTLWIVRLPCLFEVCHVCNDVWGLPHL